MMGVRTIIFPAQRANEPTNDFITTPTGFESDCAISDSVGDPVVVVGANLVNRVTSNTYTDLVVGIIKEKLTPTRCIVIVAGILEGIASGLTASKAVFVSATGTLTTTPPAGHQQILGTAISSTDIIVNAMPPKILG
jgi:hypothetical protein